MSQCFSNHILSSKRQGLTALYPHFQPKIELSLLRATFSVLEKINAKPSK
jgi:hypothetical protein